MARGQSVRYHSLAAPRRVEHFGGEELGRGRLPCGLAVDHAKGECCKTICPDPAKRNCAAQDPDDPIERCRAGLRRGQHGTV